MQKVKNAALRRRQKMTLTGRPRTDEMQDEFHSLKKTNDGSIRLTTENGKPSSAFRKKTEMLICTDKMREKYLKHWKNQRWKLDSWVIQKLTDCYGGASDWVTAVGPGKNVVQLYACEACGNAPLQTN
eukprot:2852566-Amphidinium_carterae.1